MEHQHNETFDLATHNGMVTIENPRTGEHRTFRVWSETWKGNDEDKRVVSLLVGPDHTPGGDWQRFAFVLDGRVRVWRRFRGDEERSSFDKFAALLEQRARGERSGLVYHVEGRCRRCNLPLSNPESVRTGIGPVCAEREAAA